jgi:hypothetical protein
MKLELGKGCRSRQFFRNPGHPIRLKLVAVCLDPAGRGASRLCGAGWRWLDVVNCRIEQAIRIRVAQLAHRRRESSNEIAMSIILRWSGMPHGLASFVSVEGAAASNQARTRRIRVSLPRRLARDSTASPASAQQDERGVVQADGKIRFKFVDALGLRSSNFCRTS